MSSHTWTSHRSADHHRTTIQKLRFPLGNSNVTSREDALRARFFSRKPPADDLCGSGQVRAGLCAGGEWPVLGLESPFGVAEDLECVVERVAIVCRHHAGSEQRSRRRDRRMDRHVDEYAPVIERLPKKYCFPDRKS